MKPDRRIVAIVLTNLFVEIAERRRASPAASRASPLAVLLTLEGDDARKKPLTAATKREEQTIVAINESARRSGVRVGQTVVEAGVFTARLEVVHVDEAHVIAMLETVAEVALTFGATAHVDPWDTVWLDVSGSAHLFGGEDALLVEIEERVRALGFSAQVAIADGPRIAQALARNLHLPEAVQNAPKKEGKRALAGLPLCALLADPSLADAHSLFIRLGVLTIDDFVKLPHAELSSRLGGRAGELIAIAMGHDPLPLEPYEAPNVLVDEVEFDVEFGAGVEIIEPLLFVLRGVTSRLAARLVGRAEACNRIELTIQYDRRIHALRRGAESEPTHHETIDLPAPLSHEGDLFRTVKAKLEQLELVAPATSIAVTLSRIIHAPRIQLDLSRDIAVSPDALPSLMAELAADIGADNVGVLAIVDSFKPEARSNLVGVGAGKRHRARSADVARPLVREPTRLFRTPLPMSSIEVGATVFAFGTAFEIADVTFDRRLDAVEWWTDAPASRDYLTVRLSNTSSGSSPSNPSTRRGVSALAWAFVDRRSGEAFIQGLWE